MREFQISVGIQTLLSLTYERRLRRGAIRPVISVPPECVKGRRRLDDDDEFDNVADIFDDQFSEEIEYDEAN